MSILVSGSLAYDRILNFNGAFKDHILPDKIHTLNLSFFAEEMRESYGGTAGNIAYTLALLGETPIILANAGNDFDDYASWLKQNGISLASIGIDRGKKTAVATILTDTANNQLAAFYPGPMADPYSKEVPDGDFGIVSAGNPDDMRQMPELFRARKIPYFFDPAQGIPILSGEDLKNGIRGAEALISNDYELALIKEKTGWNESDILGVANMIITTFGDKGSRVQTENEMVEVGTAPVSDALDPTGAGDAYRAGFIAAYTKKTSLKAAAQVGTIAASYTVELHGTQTHAFTFDDIEERYKNAFGEAFPF